jgi:hypothetical protein
MRTLIGTFGLAFVCSACVVGDSATTETLEARGVPQLQIDPNPVEAGPLNITSPIATGRGFAAGRTYTLELSGGYNSGVLDAIRGYLVADSSGEISWPVSSVIEDKILSGPTATLTATYCKTSRGSSCSVVASTTLTITPPPGTASVEPLAALPGIARTVSGSGAPPDAALEMVWDDVTQCSCSWFSCSDCVYTRQTVTLTADASGNFGGTFTPSPETQGYCRKALTIMDPSNGSIVASSSFTICP